MSREIEVKSILNKTKTRDSWFLDDYTVNLYQGCSYNCLYCYIRGSKYGLNLAEKLTVKTNALELLDKQLFNRAKKGQHGYIAFSSVTDPYLPLEKKTGMMRQALEIVLKYRFPVHIITKSTLVERDFDLLNEINQRAILPEEFRQHPGRGVLLTFSFCSLETNISKIFEPGAPPPEDRIRTIRKAKQSGLKPGISLMPLLPYISDKGSMLEEMYARFSEVGVDYILPSSITLFGNGPSDSKTLVMNAVKDNFPELLGKYERYFSHANHMPSFYQKAFDQKMDELSQKFGVKRFI